MRSLRLWTAWHAGALEGLYSAFMRMAPYLRRSVARMGRSRGRELAAMGSNF